jgi:hypothetical protein
VQSTSGGNSFAFFVTRKKINYDSNSCQLSVLLLPNLASKISNILYEKNTKMYSFYAVLYNSTRVVTKVDFFNCPKYEINTKLKFIFAKFRINNFFKIPGNFAKFGIAKFRIYPKFNAFDRFIKSQNFKEVNEGKGMRIKKILTE